MERGSAAATPPVTCIIWINFFVVVKESAITKPPALKTILK